MLVLNQAMRLVGIGLILGLGGALWSDDRWRRCCTGLSCRRGVADRGVADAADRVGNRQLSAGADVQLIDPLCVGGVNRDCP